VCNDQTDLGPEIKKLIDLAKSQEYSPGNPAEGIVIRPLEERRSVRLKGRLSVKVINENFSLKYEE
jgi:hypothetical protein